jgi:hypothetical protein
MKPCRAEWVDLEGLEALRDHLARRLEEGLGRALGPVPAIGIAKDAVAHSPAEQLIDWNAQRLAEDIPARDLDGGDDRAMDVAGVERDAVEQAFGERTDAAGILPDDQMFELADAGLGRADETVESALANAMDAGVGMDLDEEPILPAGADRERLDAGDPHQA